MNVFIDTNVFLSFYHLTSEDLEELRKLKPLIEHGEIQLFLPEQVKDEYLRNREVKILAATKVLKEQKLSLKFPAMCKDYPEYEMLREIQSNHNEAHSALVTKLSDAVSTRTLTADTVIRELFDLATTISTTTAHLAQAEARMAVGNPPGKKGSLGDAINWEVLLSCAPEEDLFLIADDRDYYSVLDENQPKEFLVDEWFKKKQSKLFNYRRISEFFKENYPNIKVASEFEKELAVNTLIKSNSFSTTHQAISKLKNFEGFSEAQATAMAEAAISNEQVNWIISDKDVHEFFSGLETHYSAEIEESTLVQLTEILMVHEPAENDASNF